MTSDEIKDEDILREQSKQIEDQINKVKEQKLGRIGSIFKIKEGIIGPKKGSQVTTAVRHPDNGDMVVANEEIKRVTLEYCVCVEMRVYCHSPTQPQPQFHLNMSWELHDNG